jgi:hypothetical protein
MEPASGAVKLERPGVLPERPTLCSLAVPLLTEIVFAYEGVDAAGLAGATVPGAASTSAKTP